MMLEDEAELPRRRARAIDQEVRFDRAPVSIQLLPQNRAGHIVADDAGEQAFRAEACDISRHIAGAADDDVLAAHPDDRRGRLRRNARHIAIDEIVEHQVADTENRLPPDLRESFLEIEHYRVALPVPVGGVEDVCYVV